MTGHDTPEDQPVAEATEPTITGHVMRPDGTCPPELCVATFGGECRESGCDFVARLQKVAKKGREAYDRAEARKKHK